LWFKSFNSGLVGGWLWGILAEDWKVRSAPCGKKPFCFCTLAIGIIPKVDASEQLKQANGIGGDRFTLWI